jgi:hypothetical protein
MNKYRTIEREQKNTTEPPMEHVDIVETKTTQNAWCDHDSNYVLLVNKKSRVFYPARAYAAMLIAFSTSSIEVLANASGDKIPGTFFASSSVIPSSLR